jgi:hypothetical protein
MLMDWSKTTIERRAAVAGLGLQVHRVPERALRRAHIGPALLGLQQQQRLVGAGRQMQAGLAHHEGAVEIEVGPQLAGGRLPVAPGAGNRPLRGLDRGLCLHDVEPRRLARLEEVAGLREPLLGEGERLLLDLHEGDAADHGDVLGGGPEQDPVFGRPQALLGGADALPGLVVGPLVAQTGEDRLRPSRAIPGFTTSSGEGPWARARREPVEGGVETEQRCDRARP